MKKIIFFILIISNLAIAEDCGWKWNNPLPQGNNLRTVQFVNDNIVYITGEYGTLMKSTDAGLTWNTIKTNTTDFDYSYIFDENNFLFINVKTSTGSNNDSIIKTTDDGKNWEKSTIPFLFENYYYYYHFIDLDNGFCISQTDSILYKTNNCGISWDTIKLPFTFDYYTYIHFINKDIFFIYKSNLMVKTTDCGKTWNTIDNIPESDYLSLYFINENIGWLNTSIGLMKTTDCGKNWNLINTLTYDISGYYFINENTGYLILEDNTGLRQLYKTTNGCQSLNRISTLSGFDPEIENIAISNKEILIGAGNRGIIKRTTNDGYNWVNINSGSFYNLSYMQFINKDTIWGVGANGIIKNSTDAGRNWSENKTNLTDVSFFYVNFFNSSTGIIADYYVNFFKTTNNGKDWVKIGNITDSYFEDACFVNEKVGWVSFLTSTKEYFIMKTTDGGEYWSHCKTFKDTVVPKIHFFNENLGYAIGSKGAFFKTTDGGKYWVTKIIDSTKDNNSMSFINENLGWITTFSFAYDSLWNLIYYGDILKTTDGGNSWEKQLSGEYDFLELQFLDENNGWVTSSNSYTYRTTDGGLSWDTIPLCTNKWINNIFCFDKDNCWVVGADGIILHYSCTETAVEEPLPITTENNDFQIFPNPTSSEITFSIPDEQNINSISIFNSLGMEVKSIEQTKIIGNSKITISIADLPNGLYNCSFVNQTGRVTKSFVVLR